MYTWQLRGHELIEAERKLPFKSMSEDIKRQTTIPTLGQTVTEAAVASARYPSLATRSRNTIARNSHRVQPWEPD